MALRRLIRSGVFVMVGALLGALAVGAQWDAHVTALQSVPVAHYPTCKVQVKRVPIYRDR